MVEDEPSEEVRKLEGLGDDETLLGYYQGIPLAARGDHYGVGVTMPDTITIYKLPILEAAKEDNMDLNEIKKLIEEDGTKLIIVEQGRPTMVITSFEAYQKKKGGLEPKKEPPAQAITTEEELKIEDLPF